MSILFHEHKQRSVQGHPVIDKVTSCRMVTRDRYPRTITTHDGEVLRIDQHQDWADATPIQTEAVTLGEVWAHNWNLPHLNSIFDGGLIGPRHMTAQEREQFEEWWGMYQPEVEAGDSHFTG